MAAVLTMRIARKASTWAACLRERNAGDLPVQQAVKIELVLNLRTAKALGLTFAAAERSGRRGDSSEAPRLHLAARRTAAAWPLAAERSNRASCRPSHPRGSAAAAWSKLTAALVQRLRELGHVRIAPSRSVSLDEGRNERYGEIADELVG